MPDNKLTDNEIIKAYEFCLKNKGCTGCVADKNSKSGEFDCKLKPQDIIDLFNRLQAENESLKAEYDKQYEIAEATIRAEIADGGTSCHWCEDTIRGVAKAEAYKEFAEKMEERIAVKLLRNKSNEYAEGFADALDGVNGEINNLLKELVGEDK